MIDHWKLQVLEGVHGGDDFIHKQNDELAPVQLLCFININGIKDESSFMISVCTIKKERTYAVCHAVTQFPHCLKVTKDLKTDVYHMKSNNLLLYLLPIENILWPCICVPNIFGIEHNGDLSTKNIQADKVEYLLLEDPNAWSELFVQWMESSNDNDENDGTDSDDDNVDDNDDNDDDNNDDNDDNDDDNEPISHLQLACNKAK